MKWAVFFLAVFSFAQTLSPDIKEIRDYKLTLDKVRRYVTMVQAIKSDPKAAKCFDVKSAGHAASLDEGEKAFGPCPEVVAIVKGAGFKPREALVLTAALLGDLMAVGMKEEGAIKDYPPTMSPANAAFVEANYDKLTRMLAPLKRAPASDGSK